MNNIVNSGATPVQQLTFICEQLLKAEQLQYGAEYEMEVKFGTKGGAYTITNMDYNNVVKKLKSVGFKAIIDEGSTSLKISPEITNIHTDRVQIANDYMGGIRVEINGINNIQKYCTSDSLAEVIKHNPHSVNIIKKLRVNNIKSAEFNDFNFRVTYNQESPVTKTGNMGNKIIDNWLNVKKTFRYLNRVSFTSDSYPSFRFDLSIVKSSNRVNRVYVPTYNIFDSNVFNNPEQYEIEIEVINLQAKINYTTPTGFANDIKKMALITMGGIQQSNYPISVTEQQAILSEYMTLVYDKSNAKYNENKRILPEHFIGPSSITLQLENINKNAEGTNANITLPYMYCVTDKADGHRHLMFITKTGRIYLIDTNMNVTFTGAQSKNKDDFSSILDGELILHGTKGEFINTYAAFDIYFKNGKNIREYPFMFIEFLKDEYKDYVPNKCRLNNMHEILGHEFGNAITRTNINAPRTHDDVNKILIIPKTFHYLPNIFKASSDVLKTFNPPKNKLLLNKNKPPYVIDGLIYTPTIWGVGGNKFMEAGPLKKITWNNSFKHKPPEYNTIDFLITTVKKDGKDLITPIFKNGTNLLQGTDLAQPTQFEQYKSLVLRIGYNETKDGYINPCQDVYDNRLGAARTASVDDIEAAGGNSVVGNYKPVQFYPTNPADPQAGLCNIKLKKDALGNYQMFTEGENPQVFGDKTIVEFKYDMDREGLWRWIPLHVRYDKTRGYNQGMRNYGNSYTTANSNWKSIHYPITYDMITTGENIPDESISEDVYYNNTNDEKLTKGMRDFHNLVIKRELIKSVAQKGDILIDYACGKGGDFPKWIDAHLSFVFGIDISKDNLENRLNGACARYLNYAATESKKIPKVLFVNGNSALNIKSGNAMLNPKAVAITKTVFGTIPKDPDLGAAVVAQYAVGSNGFNISSCQFAIHYMCKNATVFYNFIQNIAECTKIGGYFIGTSYDGKTMFDMLRPKIEGENESIYAKNGKKIWQVTKKYSSKVFNDDSSSLGYEISVFQDSINQDISEYLVNYTFLERTLLNYGFVLIDEKYAKSKGLPSGTAMFGDLYNAIKNRNSNMNSGTYGKGMQMESYEKTISFLNRYFVYKKVRDVDTIQLTKMGIEGEINQQSTDLQNEPLPNVPNMNIPLQETDTMITLVEAPEALSNDK